MGWWVGGEPGKTEGPTLRGAARRRTLQEGPNVYCGLAVSPRKLRVPTARSGQVPHTPGGTELTSVDLGLVGDWHTWFGQFRSGRFGDTVRWACVVCADRFGLGCRGSGRFGDTFLLVWVSTSGRSGDTLVRVTGWRLAHVVWLDRTGRFGDTFHLVVVDFGTLRRYRGCAGFLRAGRTG